MKRLNASVGKFAPPDTAGGEERDHEEQDEHEEKLGCPRPGRSPRRAR
jgi:hypothetical protein